MQDFGVLFTFVGGLSFALVLGYLARFLKLSPIVGYLLAGLAVGPFTPGFVADHSVAEQFAEIGVILLLFGIGLRFHLEELFAVWRLAVPGALVQSTVSTVGLAAILHFLGWSWSSGLILGMAVSVASTVVMALVLAERHDLHSKIGHIAIGWTVVEDLLTVAALILLPILFAPASEGPASSGAASALGMAALKVAGLVLLVVLLGRYGIPWFLDKIAKTRSSELFTLAVLVLALGIAVLSAKLFGVSMALGAFLAGLAVGRSEFAARAASDAVPMRDAFAVLFFVSVGMLFNPSALLAAPGAILAVMGVVMLLKPAVAALTLRALKTPPEIAIPVGAAFSQVGEFSFILGAVARKLGLLDETGWNALIASAILSIALSPSLYRRARAWVTEAKAPLSLAPAAEATPDPQKTVLVGYGPVGRIVESLLSERGHQVTIVDLNLETIRRLKEQGKQAIYGDVLRAGVLAEAQLTTAGTLILSAEMEDSAELVRQSRALNPKIKILARCSHLRTAHALKRAGADWVAAGEAEVGVSLLEWVLSAESKSAQELQSERSSAREHLYREAAS